jgi:hypothetical protein
MDDTLHHPAPGSYSGQWPRFFMNEIKGRLAAHCPEWHTDAIAYPQVPKR